jgi:kumamolisin
VEQKRSVLAGSSQPRAAGATLLGPADPQAGVDVTVVLKPAHPIDDVALSENALAPAAQRVFSNAGELAAPPDAIAAVNAFAASYELEVTGADPIRRTVRLSGTVANLERAFGTTLNMYSLPTGERFRGREGMVSVPASLAPFVTAVLGFTTLRSASPRDPTAPP